MCSLGSVRLSLFQPQWGELRHGDKKLYSYCWDTGEGLGLFPVRFFILKAAGSCSGAGHADRGATSQPLSWFETVAPCTLALVCAG